MEKGKRGLAGAELIESNENSGFAQCMADILEDRHSLCEVRLLEFDSDELVVNTVSVDYFENVCGNGSIEEVTA